MTRSTMRNRQRPKGRRYTEVKIPVDGIRLMFEIVVAVCHAVSFFNVTFSKTVPSGISWTLLTLCITTINTMTQFQNEGRWRFGGDVLFTIPMWAFIVVIAFLIASFFTPELSVVVQNKFFIAIVSGALTLRQAIHAKMIVDIYMEGGAEE